MVSNFKVTSLIAEEAISRRKSNVWSNLHSRPRVINKFSENDNTFLRNNFVPGDVTYADAAKSLTGHRKNRIEIFGNSITPRVRDFNSELDTGHAKIRTFHGAILKEFPHYVIPTLEDGNFDIAF